jgi:hypothetical protein
LVVRVSGFGAGFFVAVFVFVFVSVTVTVAGFVWAGGGDVVFAFAMVFSLFDGIVIGDFGVGGVAGV